MSSWRLEDLKGRYREQASTQLRDERTPTRAHLTIRGLPPTDNHAYGTRRDGGRFLKYPASHWKTRVAEAALEQHATTFARFRSQPYALHLTFWFPLLTRDGVMRLWDVSSHQKITVDAVSDLLLSDDTNLMRLVVEKRDAPKTDSRTDILVIAWPA